MTVLNSVTSAVIGAAIDVHRELGPGLLESTYEACLAAALTRRGVHVRRQVPLPIIFQGETLDPAYRVDLLVERCVIVELKTVDALTTVHFAQLITYLKLSNLQVGLLLNFNVDKLKKGIRRVVLGYQEPSPRVLKEAPRPRRLIP